MPISIDVARVEGARDKNKKIDKVLEQKKQKRKKKKSK
jgi:hypothetical protein